MKTGSFVLALIGARDLDPREAVMLQASGISYVEAASLGPELSAAIGEIATRRACVYLHLDLDVLDPSVGRVNEYAAAGGLSCEDVTWAIDEIRQSFYLYAASLTAFDPAADADGRALNAAVALGVALVEAAPAIDDESSS